MMEHSATARRVDVIELQASIRDSAKPQGSAGRSGRRLLRAKAASARAQTHRRDAGVGEADALGRSDARSYDSRAKRVLDLVIATLALLIVAPALAAIALSIWAESGGPVLFRQERTGFRGKPFTIFKFRTMTQRACREEDRRQAEPADKRVTRVGRLLRRTSLDELPQIINVFKGDMSLVGPRPHPCWLDVSYAERIPAYAERFRVKPGITGLAQVNGFRGETSSDELMIGRLRYDLEYIRTRDLGVDIRIIAQTAIRIWSDSNAY
jgi:putative colanic acid biosynthesis UDP-glucose lipid carrier transferase